MTSPLAALPKAPANMLDLPAFGNTLNHYPLTTEKAITMEDEKTSPEISYQIRVKPGRAGTDPNAPDWEVCELEDGVVKNTADIYDNMTEAEAHQIAGMWRRKKEA